MSVIGIDFGNESSYVAVARAGGIETIANEYSLRATPSCVAFGENSRILGVAAKNQLVTNMRNTIYSFKRFLGRHYTDPHVQKEMMMLPFKIGSGPSGGVMFKVNYMGEEQSFTPEQITGMLFTKLKDISEAALKTKVVDCVISVPAFFTNAERRALLDAAQLAGLNALRLMNETTATALAYGIYKQDLPGPDDKPRNVVFVDCGQSSLQVSAAAFNKGKLKMLSMACDPYLGGRDFDYILAEYFARDFQKRYHINALNNPRAFTRLLGEVEKLKKQMSANSTKLPLNIECFMDDKDVHGDMKRVDFEEMCSPLFERVESTLRRCLDESKLRLDEIYAVEIVGGSSRVPSIKMLIEKVYNKSASTTLNQDEAVARGCALQCAMLSPAFKVREFSVTDLQPYPIRLVWDASGGEDGEMEVFPKNHPVPFSKMLTFYRKELFTMKALYSSNIPFPDPFIGEYRIRDVRPTPEGESQKVKVKVRINLHGIFMISSASLVEKKEVEAGEEEQMEVEAGQQQQAVDGEQANHQQNDEMMNEAKKGTGSPEKHQNKDEGSAEKKDGSKKKKQVLKNIDLPVDSETHGLSLADLNNYTEQECKMIAQDRREKERADARNALEEYVYDLRSRLSDNDDLGSYVVPNDRSTLIRRLEDTENWLYEEGENCTRQVYSDRLSELQSSGEPIKTRRAEFLGCPSHFDDLRAAHQRVRKALDQYHKGDERFAHIEREEMDKVVRSIEESHRWVEENAHALNVADRTVNPPVGMAQIQQQKMSLETVVNPILNKPKPKVEPPPEPAKPGNGSKGQGDSQNGQQPASEEKMDVE